MKLLWASAKLEPKKLWSALVRLWQVAWYKEQHPLNGGMHFRHLDDKEFKLMKVSGNIEVSGGKWMAGSEVIHLGRVPNM